MTGIPSMGVRNKLVQANIGLAISHAVSYAKRYPFLDLDDAIQEASMALVKAAGSYDPDRGEATFASFAYNHLRGALHRLRERHPIVCGVSPGDGVDRQPETEAARLRAIKPYISLNRPINTRDEDDSSIPERIDFLRSDLPDPEERYAKAELEHHARRLIDTLPPRSSDILRRRLAGERGRLVGASHGVTKQAVEQIEKKSLAKLRSDPWVRKTAATGGV